MSRVWIPARSDHWLWVTCPLLSKNPIFDLVRSIACFVLTGSLWKLQTIWTGIKPRTSSNSGKITLLSLEFIALECKKIHIRLCPEHSLCNFYLIFMKMEINIKYLISLKLGHIALFNLELHALDCWHIESQVSDCCPLDYLLIYLVSLILLRNYSILMQDPKRTKSKASKI